MNIISGEKFQRLCGQSISKLEHKKSEAKIDSIDVDSFDFKNFDNHELVYINISLFNTNKPKLVESKIIEKLTKFQNKFDLVLHNSDDNLDVPKFNSLRKVKNLNRIYSKNCLVKDDKVVPLPIGLANSCWPWGDEDTFKEVLQLNPTKKDKLVFSNFTIDGGVRDEDRLDCHESVKKNKIDILENKPFGEYLHDLSQYKYVISPEGNGIDCHRTWEALYFKVIPICKKSVVTEYFSKIFPIYLIDDWYQLNLEDLNQQYTNFSWKNYNLLDFDNYIKHIGL
tara:strand:+ start:103 stop:948 length:846 start_codon:yes stop_codon:yes gene_type:complete